MWLTTVPADLCFARREKYHIWRTTGASLMPAWCSSCGCLWFCRCLKCWVLCPGSVTSPSWGLPDLLSWSDSSGCSWSSQCQNQESTRYSSEYVMYAWVCTQCVLVVCACFVAAHIGLWSLAVQCNQVTSKHNSFHCVIRWSLVIMWEMLSCMCRHQKYFVGCRVLTVMYNWEEYAV